MVAGHEVARRGTGYVLDGGGLACLGLILRDGDRKADLRKPLAVALEIARHGHGFACYLDRNLPYRVRQDHRDLLDLLLSEHPENFRPVPPRAALEDYLLQRAGSGGAVVVSPEDLGDHEDLRDRHAWLAEPGRHLRPALDGENIVLSPIGTFPYARASAFDLYHELTPHLTRP